MLASKRVFRCFLVVSLICLVCMAFVGFKLLSTEQERVSYNDFWIEEDDGEEHPRLDDEMGEALGKEAIEEPVILWWTPFTGEKGRYKTCGDVRCFFTVRREFRNHPNTKVFMFYGTDFKVEDLPLPRLPHHEWGLLHEESLKNNYLFNHKDVLTLFNHTATFRRQSDYPITTQHLPSLQWLENSKHLHPTNEKNELLKELAPLVYVHSDCNPPSDRDHYVQMLMEYVAVDSYGTCIHNKDLPEHLRDPIEGMDHEDFYRLLSRYKFALAMENGVCEDYITEKLWRPLMLGVVPVVYGSPTVKDFLPSNNSAIVINDFKTIKELADYISHINDNDEEYDKLLQWKKTGVTNQRLISSVEQRDWSSDDPENPHQKTFNFIDGFECHVCQSVHRNRALVASGREPVQHQATPEHYGCPKPAPFDSQGMLRDDPQWEQGYETAGKIAHALRYFLDRNLTFTMHDLHQRAWG